MLCATTGSVTRITRCTAGGFSRNRGATNASSTMPLARRNLSVVSIATSAEFFSQCWPHSISTAVRGLAGSLKAPRSIMRSPAGWPVSTSRSAGTPILRAKATLFSLRAHTMIGRQGSCIECRSSSSSA